MDTGPGSNGTNPGTVAAFGGGLDGHLLSELQSAGVKLDNIETVFYSSISRPRRMDFDPERQS